MLLNATLSPYKKQRDDGVSSGSWDFDDLGLQPVSPCAP